MEKKIRVGLIGYGLGGRVFHAPLILSVLKMELVSISTSRSEEIARLDPKIRVAAAPEEIFQDATIDLVVISTPTNTHAPLAMGALQAGKHVVVDKPFALNLIEAKELIDLAKKVGKQLFVFHNRRWDSDFLSVRSAIDAGMIGNIVHFESHIDRFRPNVQDRWKEDGREDLASGMILVRI
jgi:predicted dehydrogenase